MTVTALTDLTKLPNQSQDQATFDANWAYTLEQMVLRAQQENETAANLNAIAAGGAYAFPYIFDSTTTDGDPGVGKLRLGSATQNASTVLRIDTAIVGGADISNVFFDLGAGTSAVKGSIRLVKQGDASKWMIFDITAVTSMTGYRNLAVAHRVGSAASPFANTDAVLVYIERSGDKGDLNTYPTVIVRDEKASGTNGGTPTGAGAWLDRTLNTMAANTAGASLSANAVTLPAGKWEYEGSAPAYGVNANQARLFNSTDSTLIGMGSSESASANYLCSTRSVLRGEFTLAAAKAIKVQHFVATATAGGWGALAGTGGVEAYTEIKFRKVG